MIRAARCFIGGIALLHLIGCAAPSTRIDDERLHGTWLFESAVNRFPFPNPKSLTFRQDGKYTAEFSPEAHAEFTRWTGNSLSNPLLGKYEVVSNLPQDLFLPRRWLRMEYLAPYRLYSIENDRLILHNLGDSWPAWHFRRGEMTDRP